jgi:hypothetical protein
MSTLRINKVAARSVSGRIKNCGRIGKQGESKFVTMVFCTGIAILLTVLAWTVAMVFLQALDALRR